MLFIQDKHSLLLMPKEKNQAWVSDTKDAKSFDTLEELQDSFRYLSVTFNFQVYVKPLNIYYLKVEALKALGFSVAPSQPNIYIKRNIKGDDFIFSIFCKYSPEPHKLSAWEVHATIKCSNGTQLEIKPTYTQKSLQEFTTQVEKISQVV